VHIWRKNNDNRDKRGGKTRARRTSLDTIQYIAVDRENGGRK